MSQDINPSLGKIRAIENSVTNLLVFTKQLPEVLIRWSRGQASEAEVSDVYVQLGNEFNLACRSFLAAGFDVRDLGDVPNMLRVVLERALADDPREESLTRYLPRVREIIVTLLQRIRHKQNLLKVHEDGLYRTRPATGQSWDSWENTKQKQQYQTPNRSNSSQSIEGNQGAAIHTLDQSQNDIHYPQSNVYRVPVRSQQVYPNQLVNDQSSSGSRQSSQSSSQLFDLYTHDSADQTQHQLGRDSSQLNKDFSRTTEISEGSLPVPSRNTYTSDPLAALQKSGRFERRASKRLSAYQYSKRMNGGIDHNALPTKSTHHALVADYTDTTLVDERSVSRHSAASHSIDKSKTTSDSASKSVNLENNGLETQNYTERLYEAKETDSKDKNFASSNDHTVMNQEKSDIQSNNPTVVSVAKELKTIEEGSPVVRTPREVENKERINGHGSFSPKPTQIQVFLRLGSKIRKTQLEPPPTLAAVRLQFVNMFAYTPGTEPFPDMLIQDSQSGIDYELTEATIRDVQTGSLLTLKAVTEQESTIETKVDQLSKQLAQLSAKIDGQSAKYSTPTPKTRSTPSTKAAIATSNHGLNATGSPVSRSLNATEAAAVRQEVAVIRQVYQNTSQSMKAELSFIFDALEKLQYASAGSDRGFMKQSLDKVERESEYLLSWIEDLMDIVEAQRKDITTHGVRLTEKQLVTVFRQLKNAQNKLNELENYMAKENHTWKSTWEYELNTIVEEQEFLNMQKSLVADMQIDLGKARETFELVEQCAKELEKSDVRRKQVFIPIPDNSIDATNALLVEVSALKPNQEKRVAAIERAERLRKRELSMRTGDFEDELGEFVEENRLKQSGGVEEVERRRRERDERVREEELLNKAQAEELRHLLKEERAAQRRLKFQENSDLGEFVTSKPSNELCSNSDRPDAAGKIVEYQEIESNGEDGTQDDSTVCSVNSNKLSDEMHAANGANQEASLSTEAVGAELFTEASIEESYGEKSASNFSASSSEATKSASYNDSLSQNEVKTEFGSTKPEDPELAYSSDGSLL